MNYFLTLFTILGFLRGICGSGAVPADLTEPTHAYVFKSHDCPNVLTQDLSAIVGGGIKTILVCDIDETLLVKYSPTKLYKELQKSMVFETVHMVLALTSRAVSYCGIMKHTLSQLEDVCPAFYARLAKSHQHRADGILHKNAVVIMGESGLDKCEALEKYFDHRPLEPGTYNLVFVDNLHGNSASFCRKFRHEQIRITHSFHYNDKIGESKKVPENGVVSCSPLLENYFSPADYVVLDYGFAVYEESEEARLSAADIAALALLDLA